MLGETFDQVNDAVDVIMGFKNAELQTEECAPANIVLLDQHLNSYVHEQPDVKEGTMIAEILHDRGFDGLVCILSGGSREDLSEYLNTSGVDMVASKATPMKDLAIEITTAFWRKYPNTSK